MIEEQTLFILGAGASDCFGYPTGSKLNDDLITELIRFDHTYISKGKGFFHDGEHIYDQSNLLRFSKIYKNSHPTLVDYFLAKNPEVIIKKIGIYGIALSLINAEVNHSSKTSYSFNKDNWFSILFNKMTSDILDVGSIDRFKLNKCSFLTFNYDRLLEQLFYEALTNNYGITYTDVKNLMSGIKIIHTFGRLPLLPYEGANSEEDSFQYGKEPSNLFIEKAIKSIITIHERKNNLEEIDNAIMDAHRIFILGFGFAEENMELLNFKKNFTSHKDVNATTLGVSQKKREYIKGKYFPQFKTIEGDSRFMGIPNMPEISCKRLLEDYS